MGCQMALVRKDDAGDPAVRTVEVGQSQEKDIIGIKR